jgi:hypothetical protein
LLTAPAASEPRLEGPTFSVPVPSGFEAYAESDNEELIKSGARILAESEKPRFEHAFRANILIGLLPNKGLDLKDPLLCFSIGDNAAKSLAGTVLGVKQAVRPIGPSCQVMIQPKKDKEKFKLSRAEVVGGPAQLWMITCHYDKRDARALAACDRVVEGFQAR